MYFKAINNLMMKDDQKRFRTRMKVVSKPKIENIIYIKIHEVLI